jgi:hypothetical protein
VGAEAYTVAKKLAQKNFQCEEQWGYRKFTTAQIFAAQLKIGEEISAPGDLV